MEINILTTDTKFTDSPDSGADCICSRCGDPITDMPVRAWPDDIESNPESNYEYRYHLRCAMPGARFAEMNEYYDPGEYE